MLGYRLEVVDGAITPLFSSLRFRKRPSHPFLGYTPLLQHVLRVSGKFKLFYRLPPEGILP